MDKIRVKILHHNLNGMPLFLAKMTQRGHKINSLEDLMKLYAECIDKQPSEQLMKLPHSTIFRMCDITVAIYGLSTKAVSQLRTHATRLTFMSTSTQYSEFTGQTLPYVIPDDLKGEAREEYIKALEEVHNAYAKVYEMSGDKDASGYALPQSLRKCLVIHGNFPAWQYMLSLRSCNRNTKEVQHICELIIQAINDECGKVWADQCLPACTKGKCPEGKFSCGHPYEDKRIQPVDKLLDEDEDEEKEK